MDDHMTSVQAVAAHLGRRLADPSHQRPRSEYVRHAMGDLLTRLARGESGSDDAAGLPSMARRLGKQFGEFGPIEHRPGALAGTSHLLLSAEGIEPALEDLAVLGHDATVWPAGPCARTPALVDGHGRLSGVGSFDMKGGLVLLYFALDELSAAGHRPRRPLDVMFSCGEEIRRPTPTPRPLSEEIASHAGAALVLEPPLPGSALKTARKRTARYHLDVEGRAVHAGIEPAKGASVILDLAHQVQALRALNDTDCGTAVNVGIVRGGTGTNIVPTAAEAQIDVGVSTTTEAGRVDDGILGLRPAVPRTRPKVTAELRRPPMVPTPSSQELFASARAIAAAVGIDHLDQDTTGGGSGDTLIAALGVPTLDRLGPDYADHEHVDVNNMAAWAALPADLLVSC